MVDVVSGTAKLITMAAKEVVALGKRNDEAFAQAVQFECLESVLELQNRVARIEETLKAKGQQLADLGALRTEKHLKDFASAYADATGDEKRDALLNVAARQFDSSWQTATLRAYWFRVVASLSDVEVLALRQLEKDSTIAVRPSGLIYTEAGEPLDPGLSGALGQALLQLRKRTPRLVEISLGFGGRDEEHGGEEELHCFSLSVQGKVVVDAMAPVASGAP